MSKRIRPPVRKSQRWKRLKNQFLNVVGNPFNMVVFFSLLILFCLIIIPLLTMLTNTFTVAKAELRNLPDAQIGDFTLFYWKYLLASPLTETILWEPLLNSLLIGFFVTVISVPLGAVMAWLMVRTDIPGKKLLGMLIIVPYMIPSWCKALSWLSVFRNSTSGSLGLLTGMGVAVPDWLAYGPFAIICVMTMHYYAFSYIMVSGSLRSVNSELEEMGEIQGANKVQILKSITLPLVLPSILSAAIMTISKSLGSYGVAANLGNRISYYVLATRMESFISDSPKGVGFAMSIIMILLASGTIFANQRMIGVRKSYATIGGKGTRSNLMHIGKVKYALLIFLAVFLFVAMVMPTFVLVMESFQIRTGAGYGLDNLTLYAWIGTLENAPLESYPYDGIFRNPEFLRALGNTVKLSIIASILTAVCGQFLGYISTRGRGKWYGRATEQMVFIPYLMPGVAFSAIYFAMFSQPRLGGLIPSLYGTFTLILLVSVVKHFPFASRSGSANMMQISVELEEAADIAGASFWRRIGSIIIPLAKNGFISGFMLVFISIAKELDLIAILMTPANYTLSYLSFEYSKSLMPQCADAIAICILLFILICYRIANHFGADIGKSWG
ncbi:MAG TPA: iron ABC transporter permease [Candidatus Aphodomorpha intestinavium]|uniref:Iron ABC transporter permease n=1 Tax=Candidatus Aphodomorpha intestinavium TaxID=2840672 RepID=A0A9D1N3L4_9FIRM|nr:iron ABC transporter permease [Candidatus Aphodomorpha intestinavium]